MAKTSGQGGLKFLGLVRRNRAGLLGATALQTAFLVVLAAPAVSQPAPNARPQGGMVVGGAAQISRSAAATTIYQTSPRAAIDWTSFNVGSNQSVNFKQPSASAITLNRVTSPDPSAIAGSIHANGQIVLTNRSGVVFYKGSQVDAQSVVVSAPGITTANFMAGRMVFDQAPNPNARIANAGRITVRQAGLAALVAPQVANSGTITASMGHVVLAGAMAHTVDLYGDGLLSIDVTRQVVQAPLGADGKPVTALVTNTGVIAADGGTVQLTAAAADGIVQNLVDAGGRISANSAGSQAGRIDIAGTGGSVIVTGLLSARGNAEGGRGGQITVNASDAVTIADGARVNASGRAGGGVVAIGTTLARATQGPALGYANAASSVTVARGARVAANATRAGNGGIITVLSTQNTTLAGRLSARGGKAGGNGGAVEISGAAGFHLTGPVDTGAPAGHAGSILLDPANLTITEPGTLAPGSGNPTIGAGDGGSTTDATVSATALEGLTGSIHLLTTNNLTVAASLTLIGAEQTLTLEAGNAIKINAGVTVRTASDITLISESTNVTNPIELPIGRSASAGITILGDVITPTGTLTLNAGSAGITLAGNVTAGATAVTTTGALTQTSGVLTTGSLTFTAGSVSLPDANLITQLGGESANSTSSGGILITEAPGQNLLVSADLQAPTGQSITLTADTMHLNGTIDAPSGTVTLAPVTAGRGIDLVEDQDPATDRLVLTNYMLSRVTAGTLQIGSASAGPILVGLSGDALFVDNVTTLNLASGGAVTEGGSLETGTLAGAAASMVLDNAGNNITTLGAISTTNGLTIVNGSPLTVSGTVTDAHQISLQTSGLLTLAGTVTAPLITLTALAEEVDSTLPPASFGQIEQTAGSVNGSTSVTLSATGAISQTGGVFTGGTLTGSSGGTTALTSANNAMATLGAFSSTGGFTLANSTPLTVAGPLTDTASITLDTGALALTGTLNAPTLVLTATGAITQTSGHITATTLSGSAASADLSQAANAIGTLTQFTTSGDFSLTDGSALDVTQTVAVGTGATLTLTGDATQLVGQSVLRAPGGTIVLQPLTSGSGVTLNGSSGANALPLFAQTLVLGSATAGPITLDGQVNLSNVAVLDLLSATAATQNAGSVITVGTLTGHVGSAGLTGANQIGTLGVFQSAGDFALIDEAAVTVNGPVAAANFLLNDAAGAHFTGNVTTGSLILEGGALTQSGGVLTAAALTGSVTSAALGGSNAIARLGTFTATADFAMTDATALVVAGPLTAANVALTGSVQFTGAVTTGTLTLDTGGFTQTTGVLTAATLTGNAASAVLGGTNTITDLASFTTSGAFALTDGVALTVAGPLTGASVSLTDASPVQLTGAVTAGALSLNGGAFTQSGTLTVGTLSGSVDTLTLGGTNAVAAIGAFSTGGAFTLTDTQSLAITGTLSSPVSIGLTVTGDLSLAGNIVAPAVTLSATGAITQSAGGIATTTLQGNAASAALTSGANQVTDLGAFTTTTAFALADATSLRTTGTIDPPDLTLNVTGNLTIASALDAGTASLRATGVITETAAGSLTATTLKGGAATARFDNETFVGTLGDFATTGGFVLLDGGAVCGDGDRHGCDQHHAEQRRSDDAAGHGDGPGDRADRRADLQRVRAAAGLRNDHANRRQRERQRQRGVVGRGGDRTNRRHHHRRRAERDGGRHGRADQYRQRDRHARQLQERRRLRPDGRRRASG